MLLHQFSLHAKRGMRHSAQALFVNQLSDDELESLLGQLTKRGVIKVSEDKITYNLPA